MLALRKSPAMRIGLAGRQLRVVWRNPRLMGLGAMVHGVELEWCDQSTVEGQYACSVRNQDRINASYDEHPGSYLGGGIYAGTPEAVAKYQGGQVAWDLPGPTPVSAMTQPPAAPAPGPVLVSSYSPRVSFSTSRGGSAAYVGDTWAVTISGGKPNTSVTVTGGKNGAVDTNTVGTTDGAGNFRLTNTFDASTVGSWLESWKVGADAAGSFSFTVAPAPSTGTPPTPPGATRTGGPDPNPGQGGGGQDSAQSSGFDFSGLLTGKAFFGLPNWVWLAGGGLLIFGRRGGR